MEQRNAAGHIGRSPPRLRGLAAASLARAGSGRRLLTVFGGGSTATWLLLWLGGTWQHVSGFGFAAVLRSGLARLCLGRSP
jgi:hypothetical protein